MSSTKIINVLRDDKFEELLDIVQETDASEVIFVLPKKTKAFKSEGHFVVLADEARDKSKSFTFMCSNPEVNKLANKYNFDILSSKPEAKSKSRSKPVRSEPVAVPVVVKNNDADDGTKESEESDRESGHDDWGRHRPPYGKEPLDDTRYKPEEPAAEEESQEEGEQAEDDEDYKEEEKEESFDNAQGEEDAPYGTELDESGDPIYEEDEEESYERPVSSSNPPADFQVIAASAKTRGMGDVIRPSDGKRVKIAQKDKRPVKIETRSEPTDDIQSVWGKGSSDNIWADISKPKTSEPSSFGKFKVTGRYKPKKGFEFNGNFPKRGVTVLLAASVLVLGFVVFLTVGSARIEIKPRSQVLNTQLKVTISPNFPSVDNSFNRIPGQLFTINKSAAGEYNATAEKDAVQKARGIITIYNEYSTSPQPLIATTRFEFLKDGVESGLVFRTLQTITVPGMEVENGVVTPGKVEVEVIADKPGQAYNISAGDFGIAAWRERGETARYEKMYGRTSDSMRGGIMGKAKVVSEFDYNNAKDNLEARVRSDISEALEKQSAGLELLADIEPKVDSVESTAEIDDAADTFKMTVNGSVATIGYQKDDLMSLIAGHVEKASGLMVVPEKLELSYKDATMDADKGALEVIIVIEGQAYARIDKESLTANLMGKNELQIKDYLSSVKDIDSAKVILSPFWVKKMPKNRSDIEIILSF